MNLEDIAAELPWGLHDAFIERVELDYCAGRALLHMRFPMSEHQDTDQRGRVELEGLVYWVVECPTIDPRAGYRAHTPAGLWVDLVRPEDVPARVALPACPQGCFASTLFVHTWNAYVHLCASQARLVWVETEPQPSRSALRALYPGDEIERV